MIGLSGYEIAEALQGRVLKGDSQRYFNNVSTDTRKISEGDLFIPLVGLHYDGHDFIAEAISGGAKGIIIAKDIELEKEYFKVNNPTIIQVADTLKALQDLAGYNRNQLAIPVIGVTGSNGKTTTKDMVGAVLETRYKTLKTQGNFNNHIGLPLTLLQMDKTYQAAVVEMGMRGLGEIDELGAIAIPNIGIITSIGETHLELLGSIENIARAKGEILNHLDENGVAILNGDDLWVRKVSANYQGKVVFYGLNEGNHFRAQEIIMSEKGSTFKVFLSNIDYNDISTHGNTDEEFSIKVNLPVLGQHNVLNALAAIAVGLELGISPGEIVSGLESLKLTGMRLQITEHDGIKIINDAYNANPASMKAALKIQKELAKGQRTIAVLGNMYELGQRQKAGHQEIGETVRDLQIDYLITVGDLAAQAATTAIELGMEVLKVFSCSNNEEAIMNIKKIMIPGDVILIKGSRGMKMEEIALAISNAEG